VRELLARPDSWSTAATEARYTSIEVAWQLLEAARAEESLLALRLIDLAGDIAGGLAARDPATLLHRQLLVEVRCARAQCLLDASDPASAARELRRAAGHLAPDLCYGRALYCRALARLRGEQRRWEEALALCERAVLLFDDYGSTLEAGQVRVEAGWTLIVKSRRLRPTMTARAPLDRSQEEWSTDVTAVLEQVRPQLRRTLKAYRIPLPDSEDLIQDALLALLTRWVDIREPGIWLVGAVRHLCCSYVRQQRRRKTVAVDLEQLERLAGAVPSSEVQYGARRDLERLMRELTPQQRRLLRLSFGLGLNAHELAHLLGGARPESLRRARWRAITRLRQLLALER